MSMSKPKRTRRSLFSTTPAIVESPAKKNKITSNTETLSPPSPQLQSTATPAKMKDSNVPKSSYTSTLPEPFSPSKISHPASKVDVCAIVTSLSQLHNRCFRGELVDESASIRFVGFDPAQLKQLEQYNLNKLPVLLRNCDIQLNKYSNNLEVVIKGYTQVNESQQEFAIDDPTMIGTTNITLSQLNTMNEYDKVNVEARVVNIKHPLTVGTAGKKKQDITIADKTATATLTLWEKDINSLILNECYYIKRLQVRVFNTDHYLTFPLNGAIVTPIDDLDDVSEVIASSLEPEPSLESVEICGVKELQQYMVCIECKGKVLPIEGTSNIGHCSRCKMMQKVNRCKVNVTAKLIVSGSHNDQSPKNITLTAYEDTLKIITGSETITTSDLLNAEPFNVTYDDYNTVTTITRNY